VRKGRVAVVGTREARGGADGRESRLVLSVGTGGDHIGEDRERDEEDGYPRL
jgi:hypothetical protein